MFYRCGVILIFGIFFNQSLLGMNELKRKKIEVTIFNDSKEIVRLNFHMHDSVYNQLRNITYDKKGQLSCIERLLPNESSKVIEISHNPTVFVTCCFKNEETSIAMPLSDKEIYKEKSVLKQVDNVWEMIEEDSPDILKTDRINKLLAIVKENGSIELKPSL